MKITKAPKTKKDMTGIKIRNANFNKLIYGVSYYYGRGNQFVSPDANRQMRYSPRRQSVFAENGPIMELDTISERLRLRIMRDVRRLARKNVDYGAGI